MKCKRGLLVAVLTVLALAKPGLVRGAEEGLAGNWKVSLFLEGQNRTLWLLQLQEAEGKWTGKIIASAEGAPPITLSNVSVAEGLLRFTVTLQGKPFGFEGRLPTEKGKPIYGTLPLGNRLTLAELESTQLKSLDSYELSKEELAKASTGPQVFDHVTTLLRLAGDKKAKPEEVRSWAEKAYRAADPYGPRWQMETALAIAEALASQEGFVDTALGYARRAERSLEPKDRPSAHRRVLQALALSLKKAGKVDEAKEVESRLIKIPLVKTTPFPGRKAKSERTVLVELFTGAQCPPCVAADVAFDALEKTFKPTEAVLLQYHEHIPGPDPMTNPDSESRLSYYRAEGTPMVFFNGREGAEGGGNLDDGQAKYQEYRDVIEAQLEKPASPLKLTVSAVRKGNTIQIGAEVSDLEAAGEKVRLRLALVEEKVEYTGRNLLTAHSHVVRTMPGGAAGVALP
jgi:hypothetical protein